MRKEVLHYESLWSGRLELLVQRIIVAVYFALLMVYFHQVRQWSFFHLLFPLVAIPISFMAGILLETLLSFLPGLAVRLRKTVVFKARLHRN